MSKFISPEVTKIGPVICVRLPEHMLRHAVVGNSLFCAASMVWMRIVRRNMNVAECMTWKAGKEIAVMEGVNHTMYIDKILPEEGEDVLVADELTIYQTQTGDDAWMAQRKTVEEQYREAINKMEPSTLGAAITRVLAPMPPEFAGFMPFVTERKMSDNYRCYVPFSPITDDSYNGDGKSWEECITDRWWEECKKDINKLIDLPMRPSYKSANDTGDTTTPQ